MGSAITSPVFFFSLLLRFQEASTNESLVRLLHLSRRFISLTTRLFAIHQIQQCKYHFHPAELIQLCFEFKTNVFFESAFARLVDTRLYELTKEHKQMIGPQVYHAVAETKEILDEHRRIVACEPPIIHTHASDCCDHSQCNNDWYGVWWNGMGRYILDGRNPLSFEEAFKRFEVLKFGRMSDNCKKDMLKLVKGGLGFSHSYSCIKDIGDRLAETLEVD